MWNGLPDYTSDEVRWRKRAGRFDRMRLLTNGLIGLIVLVVAAACIFGSCIVSVGGTDGRHTGYITAVERAKNWIFDATIVYVKSNPASTQEDKYCVNDRAVQRQLEQAAEDGSRVTVRYHNDFFMMKWECNGGSTIIVGVEPATQGAKH